MWLQIDIIQFLTIYSIVTDRMISYDRNMPVYEACDAICHELPLI